jgi:hypothetical protein
VLPTKKIVNVGNTAPAYGTFFNTIGANSGCWGGLGPRQAKFDDAGNLIQGSDTNIYSTASVTQSFVSQGGLMRKVGEYWRDIGTGYYFNLLAGDYFHNYNPGATDRRQGNHPELEPEYTYDTVNKKYVSPIDVYPRMSGNYAATDGRVELYQVKRGGDTFGSYPGQQHIVSCAQVVPLSFRVK